MYLDSFSITRQGKVIQKAKIIMSKPECEGTSKQGEKLETDTKEDSKETKAVFVAMRWELIPPARETELLISV